MTKPEATSSAAKRDVAPCRTQEWVRRSGIPGIIGKTGCSRSSAWIWLFSSTLSTSARLGGERYSPTMSRTLSTNSGSLESLNVSERCGWRPKAVQIRRMVVCEKPVAAAIERIDQWVASTGVERTRSLDPRGDLIVGDCAGSAWSNLVQQGLHAP